MENSVFICNGDCCVGQDGTLTESFPSSNYDFTHLLANHEGPISLYSTDGEMSSSPASETLTQQDHTSPTTWMDLQDEPSFDFNEEDWRNSTYSVPNIQSAQFTLQFPPPSQGSISPMRTITSSDSPEPHSSQLSAGKTSPITPGPQSKSNYKKKKSPSKGPKPSRSKDKGPILCLRPRCTKIFKGNRDYNRHMKTHDKLESCHLCDYTSAMRRERDRHYEARHPDHVKHETGSLPKRTPCSWPDCKSTFGRPDRKRKHIRDHHNGMDFVALDGGNIQQYGEAV